MIISIDPHKNMIVCVEYYKKQLVGYWIQSGNINQLTHWVISNLHLRAEYDLVLIESMFIYPNERVKDPNDLLDVSKVVGICHMLAPKVIEYKAREWKGQVPKKIMHERILDALSSDEISRLGKFKNNEHVLDAAGIGLHYLGRLKRRKL